MRSEGDGQERFGSLTVERDEEGGTLWCRCDCGEVVVRQRESLQRSRDKDQCAMCVSCLRIYRRSCSWRKGAQSRGLVELYPNGWDEKEERALRREIGIEPIVDLPDAHERAYHGSLFDGSED